MRVEKSQTNLGFGFAIKAAIATASLIILLAPLSFAQVERTPAEYKLRAAYVYNFAKFISWPGETEEDTGLFHICVAGVDNFADKFSSIDGLKVRSKTVEVSGLQLPKELDQLLECDILYVGSDVAAYLRQMRNALESSNVLTVTETIGLGIINMFVEGDKVRFELFKKRAEKSGLKVSSRLLSLALVRDLD